MDQVQNIYLYYCKKNAFPLVQAVKGGGRDEQEYLLPPSRYPHCLFQTEYSTIFIQRGRPVSRSTKWACHNRRDTVTMTRNRGVPEVS